MKRFFAIIMIVGSPAFADEGANPYSFGGACDSQKSWTAAATAALNNIRSITLKLKNDPACNVLYSRMNDYYVALAEHTQTAVAVEGQSNKMARVRAELESTVNAARNSRTFSQGLQEALVISTVNGAILTADSAKASSSSTSPTPSTPTQALSRRINRSVHSGMDLVNNMAEAAMAESACIQNPNVAGPMMSALISMGAAFGSSGQDSFGNKVARLTNTMSKLMIDARYFSTFSKLGRSQFRNSISCLLETVSESYCSALDADILYQEHVRQNGLQRDPQTHVISSQSILGAKMNSPLRGFFVLTQLVPIATGWVEKVQRGVEARNSADAQFKNDILRNTITYYIQENNLFATANADQVTIRKLPDLMSKKRQVLKTIMTLSNQIIGGREELQGMNFYTMTTLPMEIPFKLIGIPLPEKVRGSTDSGFQQTPENYLQANIEEIPQFNDPDELMTKVLGNLRKIIDDAQHNAIAYYNEWFIYDQASQYVDSVTGFTYNVRDVLQHIDQYFGYIGDKIKTTPAMDSSVLPMIEDTRRRLGNVLARYEEIRVLGETFRATDRNDRQTREALVDRGVELHRKLLESAYEEFWILRARSGFLLGRVAGIVKYDMQNLLRINPEETNKIAKDIFYATGEAAFERMKEMSGSNPYHIYADIKLAQVTHLENIEAIETLLSDNFVMSMSWINMVSRNERPNDKDVRRDSLERLLQDYYTYYPNDAKPGPIPTTDAWWDIRWFGNALLSPLRPIRMLNFYWKHSNRYALWGQNPMWDLNGRAPYDSYAQSTPQDGSTLFPEEGAAERMMAHYCIQSLAFKDTAPFKRMCKDITLNSPFLFHKMTEAQKAEFDKATDLQKFKIRHDLLKEASNSYVKRELSVNYMKKLNHQITPEVQAALKGNDPLMKRGATQILARNQSSRICALREFARNNFVEYLTQGLQRQ